MLPEINGKIAWIFEEPNFDIDLIVGVENIKIKDIEQLKAVCMSGYEKNFRDNVHEGDIIVGGDNFGYGHPHWPAFIALRALGINAVIAESFAPGFYRGETAKGFTLLECPGILKAVKRFDTAHVLWEDEAVEINRDRKLKLNTVPQKTKDLIEYGGIIPYLKEKRLKKA